MSEGETGGGPSGLASECDELRQSVRRLEAELERYRTQEHVIAQALVSATRFAQVVREEARRESELVLRKARARAESTVGSAERDRSRAEEELVRLREITDRTQESLSTILEATLEQLRVEGADAVSPAPVADLEGALDAALDNAIGGASTRPLDLDTASAHGGH